MCAPRNCVQVFGYQHGPGKEMEGGKGDGQGTPTLVLSSEEG